MLRTLVQQMVGKDSSVTKAEALSVIEEVDKISSLLLYGTETRIDNVVKNKPSELLFFVPGVLTTGTFQVKVKSI